MNAFSDKLAAAVERNGSLLCLGLDPERVPVDQLVPWGRALMEQTADLVCCYKPNSAFYEQYGPAGMAALQETMAAVPAGIPVILDVKRGDIGNTATAYARAAFEVLKADAVTLSPYLGRDSVRPFLSYPGKAVFLLAQTSNPSAAEIQNLGIEPFYQQVVRAGLEWGEAGQVGFVVGATQLEALAAVRRLAPDRWLLAPGVGAQGGDLGAALAAGLDVEGGRMIVPVSRAVLGAADPRAAAAALRMEIQSARAVLPVRPAAGLELIRGLFEAGCVRFGQFTLASGALSPIYIDLRRAISVPSLFRKIAVAYAERLRRLEFECLAAVPYAALPAATAAALILNAPLIYPRKEVKAHGTGQAIEGIFKPGQRAVLIEDVITSGGSIATALQPLREAGLRVEDVVVLVDREQGGAAAMAAQGCRVQSVLTMGQILDGLQSLGLVEPGKLAEVRAYLTEGR